MIRDERAFDITKAIDERPVSSLLIQIASLCALVSFLDGLDSSSIGVAAPLIADKLRLSKSFLGPIFSSGLFGAMIGALTFGSLADRYGRKRMLTIAAFTFGIFTVTTSLVGSYTTLLVIRFAAGIGLGGATPCFIALAAEYAPKSHRATVTGLIITAFPVGIFGGSFLNAYLLSSFGWQTIFQVGGVLPLIVSVMLVLWLPESIRFLILQNRNVASIDRIISRIDPSISPGMRVFSSEQEIVGAPIRNLFAPGRALETCLIWVSFLTVFGTSVAIFFWAPTVMREHGVSLPRASMVLGLTSIGAIIASAAIGRLMKRLGSVAALSIAFIVGALATAAIAYTAKSLLLITIDLVFTGIFINGFGTTGMLALAATKYPTPMRSTAVGWGIGMGRLGQVLMPLLASFLLSFGWILDNVFLAVAGVLFVGAASLVILGRHEARLVSTSRLVVDQFDRKTAADLTS